MTRPTSATFLGLGFGVSVALVAAPAVAQSAAFLNWESPQSHPIDLTPDGQVLLAVNTADARLEVFDVVGGIPTKRGSIPVGLDPVSVRARTATDAVISATVGLERTTRSAGDSTTERGRIVGGTDHNARPGTGVVLRCGTGRRSAGRTDGCPGTGPARGRGLAS